MRKNYWILLPSSLLILALTLSSWKDIQKTKAFPEEVETILSNSCFGCHTTGAKATNAVDALDFKKWNDLKPTKKISLLNDIQEVVEEGVMPPEKFLNKYPEKALSKEDATTIVEWTKKETAKLME